MIRGEKRTSVRETGEDAPVTMTVTGTIGLWQQLRQRRERDGESGEPLPDRIQSGWLLDSEGREEMKMVLRIPAQWTWWKWTFLTKMHQPWVNVGFSALERRLRRCLETHQHGFPALLLYFSSFWVANDLFSLTDFPHSSNQITKVPWWLRSFYLRGLKDACLTGRGLLWKRYCIGSTLLLTESCTTGL